MVVFFFILLYHIVKQTRHGDGTYTTWDGGDSFYLVLEERSIHIAMRSLLVHSSTNIYKDLIYSIVFLLDGNTIYEMLDSGGTKN
jgi:hypothetical protein